MAATAKSSRKPARAAPRGKARGQERDLIARLSRGAVICAEGYVFGPGTDLESAVVAALGNFGLAGHEQPVTAEDVLDLGRIQPLIGEERPRQGETGLARREERGHVLPQGLGRGRAAPRCVNGGGGCVRAHGLKLPQVMPGMKAEKLNSPI